MLTRRTRTRILALGLTFVVFAPDARAADELIKIGTEPFVFTSDGKLVIRLFAKRDVKLKAPAVLSIETQPTNRPVDVRTWTLTLTTAVEDVIRAGGFAEVVVAAPGVSKSDTLTGRIAVPYEVMPAAGAPLEYVAISVRMLGRDVSAREKVEDAALEFVTASGTPAPSKRLIANQDRFDVCLSARIAEVKLASSPRVVDLFNQTTSTPTDAGAVTIVRAPESVGLSRVECVTLEQTRIPESAMKLTGTLIVFYTVPTAAADIKQRSWAFELSRPAAMVTFGANGSYKIQAQHGSPLRDRMVERCVAYGIVPADVKLPPVSLPSQIYEDETTPRSLEGATISAVPNDRREICFQALIPRWVTRMKGKVRVEPPVVAQATEIVPEFLIKDHVGWRASTATAAYTLALLVYWLTTSLRSELEHRSRRASLSFRLARFLATRPAFTDHADVAFVRRLLFESEQQDTARNFEAAETALTSADTRMTQLETNPLPAVPVPVDDASKPVIRLVTPEGRRVSGRELMFTTGALPAGSTDNDLLTWQVTELDGRAQPQAIGSATALKTVTYRFPSRTTATNWEISLTATNSQQSTTVSRQITLEANVPGIVHKLAALNMLPFVLSGVLAALTAYVATASAESWGTQNDYLMLFLTAFGVSAGTQSFKSILQVFRR